MDGRSVARGVFDLALATECDSRSFNRNIDTLRWYTGKFCCEHITLFGLEEIDGRIDTARALGCGIRPA
jgi:hypothetical protein